MRKIKFRVWDRKVKFMISWNKLLEAYDLHSLLKSKYKRFELMQFTGLKDKNGKEIYEGDILSYGNKRDGIIIQIVWNDLSDNGFKVIKQKDNNVFHDIRIYRFDEIADIIGNIYENPDLMQT